MKKMNCHDFILLRFLVLFMHNTCRFSACTYTSVITQTRAAAQPPSASARDCHVVLFSDADTAADGCLEAQERPAGS